MEPTKFKIERDEWLTVRGSRTAKRAAAFFGFAPGQAVVERLADDPRWLGEPVWRVKAK